MTKFIAMGGTVDGRLFPLAVDANGRLIIESEVTEDHSALLNLDADDHVQYLMQ